MRGVWHFAAVQLVVAPVAVGIAAGLWLAGSAVLAVVLVAGFVGCGARVVRWAGGVGRLVAAAAGAGRSLVVAVAGGGRSLAEGVRVTLFTVWAGVVLGTSLISQRCKRAKGLRGCE